ncbi:hypothetical protein GCM10010106_50880 [Thermopolyspora flexuosa]|nr:hypothetical protein GCM10010106_50880 [Thermopolyspora flexuosa]
MEVGFDWGWCNIGLVVSEWSGVLRVLSYIYSFESDLCSVYIVDYV